METYKQTALPLLYNKGNNVLEELQVGTEIECGMKCLLNTCTGFLFRTQEQLDDIQCYSTASYLDYTGTYNKTITGQTCQRWDKQSPHSHGMVATHIPETTLTEAENYCRDPDLTGYPWCYTTDPSIRWRSCDVMRCMAPGTNCRLYNDGTMVPHLHREGYDYFTVSN
ncbi:hypothetical protein ACF0H5_015824 [Mactra antiquata]